MFRRALRNAALALPLFACVTPLQAKEAPIPSYDHIFVIV